MDRVGTIYEIDSFGVSELNQYEKDCKEALQCVEETSIGRPLGQGKQTNYTSKKEQFCLQGPTRIYTKRYQGKRHIQAISLTLAGRSTANP